MIRVILFRAIDETRQRVITGDAIRRSLAELHANDFEFCAFTIPRPRLPFNAEVRLGRRRLSTESINMYMAKLIAYPLAAMFQRAEIYHITDENYGAVVRVHDARRCIVTFNHLAPDILRDQLGAGTGPFFKVQRFIFNGVLKAAYIVTASDTMRRHLITQYGVSPNRIVRNYYGVSAGFHPRSAEVYKRTRVEHDLPQDAFVIMHVGNCGPNKNVERLLQALALIPQNVHLLQVGGTFSHAQGRIIAEYNLSPRVHVLGFVDEDALARLYCAADLLVFPSLVEGFGLPLVEAMTSGLPVLTSDRAVTREVAGGAAELVDPTDVGALAASVDGLLQSPGRRAELRVLGLQRAKDFSWREHAECLCELYRAVYDTTHHANYV